MPTSTTNPLDTINTTAPQISDLQKQVAQYQSNLASSPTAASSLTDPTSRDLSNETEMTTLQTQLKALQKQNLTAAWYGNDTSTNSTTEGAQPGMMASALNWLQQPLYNVVKGVKAATGDTTQVPNQEFTDLLAQHGVGGIPGAVAGFTADVLFDPVNWITMGTGALIPKLGYGLAKGAIEGGVEGAARGASEGLISNLGRKASWVINKLPGVSDQIPGTFAQRFSVKVAESAANYNKAVGEDVLRDVTSPGILRGTKAGGILGSNGITLSDITHAAMKKIPYGDDLYKSLRFNSNDWVDNQKLLDVINKNKARTVGEMASAGAPSPAAIAAREGSSISAVKPNIEVLKNVPAGQEKNAMIDELQKTAGDVDSISSNPTNFVSSNPDELFSRVMQEGVRADELRATLAPAVDSLPRSGPTGVKWWDDALQKGNAWKIKIGDKEVAPIYAFMDAYNSIMEGAFKPFHVSLNPPVRAMHVLSAPAFWSMAGLSESVGDYMKNMKNAFFAVSGSNPYENLVRDWVEGPMKEGEDWKVLRSQSIKNAMQEFPGTFKKSLHGVGPTFFQGHSVLHGIDELVNSGVESGIYSADDVSNGTAVNDFVKANEEYRNAMRTGNMSGKPVQPTGFARIANMLKKMVFLPAETSAENPEIKAMMERAAGTGSIEGDLPIGMNEPSGMLVRNPELHAKYLDQANAFIKARADSGSKPFQVMKNLLDNSTAGFEHQLQAQRISAITTLMNTGVSDTALKTLSRFIPLGDRETDILSTYVKNGQKMNRMSFDYANKVSQEISINMGAMPAAIRMLRSMPLVGAPFASFTYGMAVKTAQTLAYNPAFFNKAAFLVESAEGHKTPLEKEALKSKYYQWYNEPSMARVPDAMNFFSQYPLYLNLTNALPYYTLNIFQPSSRSYAATLPDDIVQLLDRSPVMKDPLGQIIFDNLVLPAILSGTGEQPTGMSGEPLYPINATTGDKAFYAGRSLVDQFTPAIAAPAGLLLPSDYAKYYPGYRMRQMAYGKAGGSSQYPSENSLGIPSSESSASRTIRSILGYLGLPIEQANTSYAASQIKSGQNP